MDGQGEQLAARAPVDLTTAADVAVVGGKAAGLGRLTRAGFPVPPGWVLPARSGAWAGPDVRTHLVARGAGPGARFAVRSSAVGEDSAAASFAGQFRTELDVLRDDVPVAAARVVQSLRSRSALTYARRLGVRPPRAMAVLVQAQVQPELAGVCLTADPVRGTDDVILEFSPGPGEVVAGGSGVVTSHVLPRTAGGGVDDRALAADARLTAVLALAMRVERLLGPAQDVEWALAAGIVWILQARPITALGPCQRPGPAGRLGETPAGGHRGAAHLGARRQRG